MPQKWVEGETGRRGLGRLDGLKLHCLPFHSATGLCGFAHNNITLFEMVENLGSIPIPAPFGEARQPA